ncbi:MAG TPA: hypothetical protein VFX15_06890, partial [Actinomycetes bacterium]|nr:hypothetical protein [Actinomycetes bacterium]
MTGPSPLRQLLDASVADAQPRDDLATSTLNRARTQRRQRFTIAGSAIAAAAVVLGVVVVTQPFELGNSPRPDDVASNSAPTPDPDGDGKVKLTLNAPRVEGAHVGWLQGTTLHLPNGETVELPKAYDDVVSFQGGYLAADVTTETIDRIVDGEVVDSFSGSGLLASPDGIFVAWFEPNDDGPGQLKVSFSADPEAGYAES